MTANTTSTPDKHALKTSLQALAANLGKPPTVVDMHNHGNHNPQEYVDAYGSWNNALEAAGLDPDDVTKKITDQELLSELHRLADELDRRPKKLDLKDHGKYSATTYQDRFGSWTNALKEAMLETAGVSDRELLSELQRLADDLGRPPRPTDMSEHGNHGTVTYYRRFDDWNAALKQAGLETIELRPNARKTEDSENDELEKVASVLEDVGGDSVSISDEGVELSADAARRVADRVADNKS